MKVKRLLCAMLAGFLAVSATACGQNDDESSSKAANDEGPEWITCDVMLGYSTPSTTLDSKTDVVTPYVENKFHIKIGDVTQAATSDISLKEMLATRIAAGNEPDIIIAGSENIAYAVNTGKYGGGLQQYIDGMDNMNKYMQADMWPRFMIDGEKVQIPSVGVNTTTDEHTSDAWNVPFNTWALWTREDLLSACGYKFTPLSEIQAQYCDKGETPPEEAYDIDPPINTPEAMEEYLQKIEDLNLKVGSSSIIPMSLINWSQFHVGTMFNFGHWNQDENGDVNGLLGSSGAKDYYKWLNNIYNTGLLDADFISQKDDQLQQKVATGLVGVGMMVPDMETAQETLIESNPDAVIRYLPWPKTSGTTGCFDIYESGFWRTTVATDCEYKDRLCAMWDWMYSDEGLDILTWGPEDAGIWKYDTTGKKVFVDDSVKEACLNGTTGKNGADYYGLYDWTGVYFPFMSEIGICSPQLNNYNPKSYTRSYPATLDAKLIGKSYASTGGYNWDGTASYGDGSDEVAKVNNYFWSDWTSEDCAKVVTAKEDEFDGVYDECIKSFYDETDYSTAQGIMKKWFEANTAK